MRLNQITLPAQNVAVARGFYLKLGFTLIVDSDQYIRLQAPPGRHHLVRAKGGGPAPWPLPQNIFGMR